jgi:lactoylglutathione lyase
MLYKDLPAPDKRGGAHHICLMLPNVTETLHSLQEKPYAKTYNRPMDIVDGVNRKRHLSLFDPDGTRTELMEPVTIDGKPAVPSAAPPPNNAIGGVQ